MVERVFNEGFFCGPPDEKYIQVVVEAKEGSDMFNLKSLQNLCSLEQKFMENKYYKELCILTKTTKRCCRPWSLGNYVALLTKKPSCSAITVNKSFISKFSLYFRFCCRKRMLILLKNYYEIAHIFIITLH